MGESDALMTWFKVLVRAYVMVELGGIEPQISVWLAVDLCCSVVVSCDDAV